MRAAAAAEPEDGPGPGLLPVPELLSESVQAGIAAGNINLSTGSGDRLGLSEHAQAAVNRHGEILDQFERRKQLRSIVVPTDDVEVRRQLREIGQPICLFGEDAPDRRERLKELLEKIGIAALRKRPGDENLDEEDDDAQKAEVWYHEGPKELKVGPLHHSCFFMCLLILTSVSLVNWQRCMSFCHEQNTMVGITE